MLGKSGIKLAKPGLVSMIGLTLSQANITRDKLVTACIMQAAIRASCQGLCHWQVQYSKQITSLSEICFPHLKSED